MGNERKSTLLLLALQLGAAAACSCLPPGPFPRNFFVSAQSDQPYANATVIYSTLVTSPGTSRLPVGFRERQFLLRVDFTWGVCGRPTPYFTLATSAVSGAACGVDLAIGVPYILPLANQGVPYLGLCRLLPALTKLQETDLKFLARRPVCCNKKCRCANSKKQVCATNPCSVARPPCVEAQECRVNSCGACAAEWFTAKGTPACLPPRAISR